MVYIGKSKHSQPGKIIIHLCWHMSDAEEDGMKSF